MMCEFRCAGVMRDDYTLESRMQRMNENKSGGARSRSVSCRTLDSESWYKMWHLDALEGRKFMKTVADRRCLELYLTEFTTEDVGHQIDPCGQLGGVLDDCWQCKNLEILFRIKIDKCIVTSDKCSMLMRSRRRRLLFLQPKDRSTTATFASSCLSTTSMLRHR